MRKETFDRPETQTGDSNIVANYSWNGFQMIVELT